MAKVKGGAKAPAAAAAKATKGGKASAAKATKTEAKKPPAKATKSSVTESIAGKRAAPPLKAEKSAKPPKVTASAAVAAAPASQKLMSELERNMHSYYSQHCPAKIDDVPYFLKKYKGNEAQMIRNIELKYGAKFPYTSTVNYPVVYVPPTSVVVPPPAPARKVDPSSGNKWPVTAASTAGGGFASKPIDTVCIQNNPHLNGGVVHADFDCMLNQADLAKNANKFYKIQVINKASSFHLFTRWGRVGEDGQMEVKGPISQDEAEADFSKKFVSKTGYKWQDRSDLSKITRKADKYELIETKSAPKVAASTKIVPSASKLPIPTQEFLSMILDKDMFKSAMAELKLDMNALARLPLGVLDTAQITRGLSILNQIETIISPAASKGAKKKPAGAVGDLYTLSSQFYTVIPHASARHIKLPVIDSLQLLQEKYDMLNVLGDIAIGASIDTSSSLDAKYEELNCDLDVLSRTSPEFKVIEKYIASTVGYHGIKLDNVWSLCRHPEDKSFQAFSKLDNHRLLWHGTNVAVVAAIMKTGLRIMPAVSGSRVGRGIYMANELAKSASYVRPASNIYGKQTAVLFLVEAALGKQHIIYHDDSSFVAAPPGFDSVLAKSKRSPPESGDAVLTLDKVKVKVPQLPPAEVTIDSPSSSFNSDEFLIYRENQQRLRYVVTFSYGNDSGDY